MVTGQSGSDMASDAGASFPRHPCLFPGWKQRAGTRWVKNAPSPPIFRGKALIPAVAGGPCSDASEVTDHDPSDSEEESYSSVSAQEKAIVGALITAVRDTLKIEDTAGASADVSVPFGSHKLVHTAKVFPYLTYFDKFIYREWERPQHAFSVPRRLAVR